MSILDLDVPTQSRQRKTRFSDEDVKAMVALLKKGKTATLSELFDDRQAAQVAGYYAREAAAAAMGVPAKGNIRSRTWMDGEKFRASVQPTPPPAAEDKPAAK
jgi:hypothetical protein